MNFVHEFIWPFKAFIIHKLLERKKIQIDFIERLLMASALFSVMPNKLFPDSYCLPKSFMFIMYFLNKDPGSQPATGGALP